MTLNYAPLRQTHPASSWRNYTTSPDRVEAALRALLDAGLVILLMGRASSPSGKSARTAAVNSLYAAATKFKGHSGIDLLPLLPAKQDLIARLKRTPATRAKRFDEGTDIKHRFVVVDLRPTAPVVLFLATGSGSLAAEGFVQPFVLRAAELVMEYRPAVVGAKHWNRTNRTEDLVGPLLFAMGKVGAWISTDKFLRPIDTMSRFLLKMDSFAAETTNDDSDIAKRIGQVDATGDRMVDGQVHYHLPCAPAPGLGWVTMRRQPGGGSPAKIAYLDTADCRPDSSEVADGLSEVLDDHGQVVDQVANVRFFLAHYGRPEWMDDDRLWKEMSRRRYSSSHIRATHGRQAHVNSRVGTTGWQAILANLDMYETGVMRRSPGGGLPEVEIHGVMPPDGPWATPEDFARVRGWIDRGRRRAGRAVSLSLSGVTAQYDGVACRLRSAARAGTANETDPCLIFRLTTDDGVERRVQRHVMLPFAALAESIADAIITAGSYALEPLIREVVAAEARAAAEPALRLADLEAKITETCRRRDALLAQLLETDQQGQRLLHGALLAAASDEYDTLEATITTLEAEHNETKELVAAAASRLDDRALEPRLLLSLLASLRDSTDTTYSKVWRRVITNLVFQTTSSDHGAMTSRILTWRGAISLDGGPNGCVAIPFQGNYDYRRIKFAPKPRYVDRGHQFVEAMLGGTPFPDVRGQAARRANQPRVADLLGIDPEHVLFQCTDARITATATALLLRATGRNDVAVPEAPDAFVATVERVHVSDPAVGSWHGTCGEIASAMYDLAGHDGVVRVADVVERCNTTPGTVHTAFAHLKTEDPNWESRRKKGYYLTPCPHCGSHDRRPGLIPEITGLLCRSCEHDEAAVTWPLDVYAACVA